MRLYCLEFYSKQEAEMEEYSEGEMVKFTKKFGVREVNEIRTFIELAQMHGGRLDPLETRREVEREVVLAFDGEEVRQGTVVFVSVLIPGAAAQSFRAIFGDVEQ